MDTDGRRGAVRSAPVGRGRGRGRIGEVEPQPTRGRGRGRAALRPQSEKKESDDSMSRPGTSGAQGPSQLADDVHKIDLSQVDLCRRRGTGSAGYKISISTNHFRIEFPGGNIVVQQYDVEVKHAYRKLNKEETRHIFWNIVVKRRDIFDDPHQIAFDGSKQCFTATKLDFKVPSGSDPDEYHFKDIPMLLDRDDKEVRCEVYFKHVAQVFVDLRKVTDFSSPENTPLQVIDTVFRQQRLFKPARTPFIPAGRSFYAPPRALGENPAAASLGFGRELWRGFFTAAHVGSSWKPLLCLDTANTAFHKSIEVLEFMCEILSKTAMNPRENPWMVDRLNARSVLREQERKMFEREIKGLRIFITHRGDEERRRTWRVTNVTQNSASEVRFTQKHPNGEVEITVAEYFEQTYRALRFPNLPCLRVGSQKRNIYMPLEVCRLNEGQKCNKKLNEDQTASMIRMTCVDAPTRQNRIMEMVRETRFDQDPWVLSFGMSFVSEMMKLTARVIKAPALDYSRQGTSAGSGVGVTFTVDESKSTIVNADKGVWRSEREEFFSPARIVSWSLMSFMPQSAQRSLEMFCSKIANVCIQRGIRMGEWPDIVEYVRRYDDIETTMRDIVKKTKAAQHCEPHEMMIVVALSQHDDRIYAEVKRCGDVQFGVITQCVASRNVTRCQFATLQNLALKINTKMKGVNWRIHPDDLNKHFFSKEAATLFLGVDLTHPSPTDKCPSIAAIVGNIDVLPWRFPATTKMQRLRNDAIVHLREAVRERLSQFYKHTQLKPKRIIVYRDGISESLFKRVLAEEMKGVRDACTELEGNYKPPITYIVLQKGHHTRCFCDNRRDTVGKAQNVPPGTVVDTDIVHPLNNDFYLCSHAGIQGTSKPTHYFVLHDDSDMPPDVIQGLTYQLCHGYARCLRSVSIPAPAYYAALACTRARLHVIHKIGTGSDSGSSVAITERDQEDTGYSSIDDLELTRAMTVAPNFVDVMYFA